MTAMNGQGTISGLSDFARSMVPQARHTPQGRPDVSCSQHRSDNAKLLWVALREVTNGLPKPLYGYSGYVWRGSVKRLAERMWDGLDGNQESEDALAALIEFLRETVNLVLMDNKKDWWIAYEWAHRGKRQIPEPEVQPEPEPLRTEIAPADDEPIALVGGDPVVAVQMLVDEVQALRAAARITGDLEQLQHEILSLRAELTETREHNKRLRAENAAFNIALGRG